MTTLTTTLEMSKKLKLAGWSKETYYSYVMGELCIIDDECEHEGHCYAPTVTELLEDMDNNVIRQYMYKTKDFPDGIDLFRSPDKLAECYCWAKKEGLIK